MNGGLHSSGIAARLREALGRWDEVPTGRQRRLAARVGVTEGAVSAWLRNGKLRADLVPEVAAVLGVDSAWLLWGVNRQEVPLVEGLDQVGVSVSGTGVVRVAMPVADDSAYAVRLDTAVYDPRYRDGELLLVTPGASPEPGDDVLVRTRGGGGGTRIAQLLARRAGGLMLQPVLGAGAQEFVEAAKLEFCLLIAGRVREL